MATDDSVVRTILFVIAALLALPIVVMILAMPRMGMWGAGHMGSGTWDGTGATWMWLGMWLFPLLVLVGIGYLVYAAVRRSSTGAAESDPALEELRLAYARGELTDEEFETRRERLRRDG